MGFKSDIEIAQETTMAPITEIADKAGIDRKYLEQYGNYKAKIDYNLFLDPNYQRIRPDYSTYANRFKNRPVVTEAVERVRQRRQGKKAKPQAEASE